MYLTIHGKFFFTSDPDFKRVLMQLLRLIDKAIVIINRRLI